MTVIKNHVNSNFLKNKHRYHILNESPWPILTAYATSFLMLSITMVVVSTPFSKYILVLNFINLINVVTCWWKDIVRESTFEGNHTTIVQTSLKYGIILFIISEIMFFFGIFWAFFHSALSPVAEIGAIWPPKGIENILPGGIPLLNTFLLLSSGATVTWAHQAIIATDKKNTLTAMYWTLILACVFIAIQFFEYVSSSFTMSDGIYGSTFFMATGFHGLHVIIGMIFLFVTVIRLFRNHLTKQHHFGFEAAAWYWHFVDVVWLFLFITVYWWGG